MLLVLVVALAAGCADSGGSAGGDESAAAGAATAETPGDAGAGTGASDSGSGGEAAADVEELQLQMASFLSPSTAQGEAITWWIEELEARTGGKVTVETFWDSSLLGAEEIKDGLADGRVQLGNMTYAYTPSAFPITSMVEVPFLGANMPAQMSALNEMYATDEALRNEWESQGIKVMSFVGIPPALTGAPEEVTTVDWYRGKTVRASGFFVTALEAVGANPAAIPVPETYEAMQRGTIDAYGGLILDVIPALSLQEVGQHIHDPGLGHYASSTWTMSMNQWEALSPELQGIIEELNAEFPERLVASAKETEDAACTTILDGGGSVYIFSEEETQKWADAIGDTALDDWIAKAEAAGVEDGAAMYEAFKGYFDEAASSEYADYLTGMQRCVEQQESQA